MSEQQKVAFVTGASRGLGKACAVEFARAGFRVAVTARTFDADDERTLSGNLRVTAEAIAAAGGEALPIRMDLDDRASVTEAVDAVHDQWGRVDVLVNNAFYQTRESQSPLADMSIEHMDKQIRVNLVAPIFLAKLVLPGMLALGGGSVLNMVSGAGVHELDVAPGPRTWGFGYGVSKTGMIEIAAMLASQYGDRGIRSFSVQPGTVLTEQLQVAIGDGNLESDDFTPPEYAARTMVWLATAPEAAAMNGALVCAPEFAPAHGLV